MKEENKEEEKEEEGSVGLIRCKKKKGWGGVGGGDLMP